MRITRREFIATSALGSAVFAPGAGAAVSPLPAGGLAGEIGITTGSFMQHLRRDPELHKTLLLELPRRMKEDLGMQVIDVMSETLHSLEPGYLDELRARAEASRCVITNLKLNQRDVDLATADPALRRETLRVYRQSIDAAHRLGCRWVRPALRGHSSDPKLLVGGLRELVEYGAQKGIRVLIENQPWMRNDPDAIPSLIQAVGNGIAAQPDIAGFSGGRREEALRKAFRLAVSCDFKVFELGPNGEHQPYSLEDSFQIGWEAGFRGPWCIEHFHDSVDGLWRGFGRIAGLLRKWIHERQG
jgi:hypothetical protein